VFSRVALLSWLANFTGTDLIERFVNRDLKGKQEIMILMRICFIIWVCVILTDACHPRIYSFTVDRQTIGCNDSVRVCWKVKGKPTLLIHDINCIGCGSGTLQPLTLVITQDGNNTAVPLAAHDTMHLSLSSAEGCLDIHKQPDGIMDDRLRYITLVASSHEKDSLRTIEVAVRPDTAGDEVIFRTALRGDTLVGGGINNPLRWGDEYDILTVADTSNRPIEVVHAHISRVLHREDPPDGSFKGTPVTGNWVLRTYLTPADKNNPGALPNTLEILITIKHR
jgi:hypothetical protein